ncbi:peptidase [Burkholderia ubonensis]|uniref:Do family serine endopeptidase n=1 Tax=Burkholderia ubonensis TaxID=101571 RepID=UPI0007537F3C|nr:Do family serine endopeptidase [Burkholderia ubonensis]KVO93452.1 peptidase [Burkholderia ubonensis]OJB38595.1 peptidase [Burkholderia ubonensis]OJB60822.1 peptidase [Burkholderia ubonensis]
MNDTQQILWRFFVASLFVAIFHLAAGSTVGFATTADAMIAPTPSLTLPDFATLVKRYEPAVVNISVTHEITQMGIQLPPGIAPGNPLAPFLARRIIGNREELSLGSGFIVSSDGYILTNRHVVGDASVVDVKLTDKREFKGRVIGGDALSDVALVKIDVDHLPVVVFGSPDKVQVGDWVMAIGSPYGFANTVTAGIVSAKSRSLAGETYIPFIQTDVPINPGNSGGPLFDLKGQVVGINSMIYSKTGGYQGLSFAIPIDVALDVKDQLLKTGKVTRGTIGVTAQEMSQSLARSFKVPALDGALISSVAGDGSAARAGLQSGDVVMAVNGERLSDAADLFILVARIKPGDPADLLVWRGGQARHIVVTVGALDSMEPSIARGEMPARLGMTVRPLTPDEQRRVAVNHGLLVEQVRGRITSVGLRPGDIILSVNETPVGSIGQLTVAINQAHGNVALLIQRNKARLFLSIDPNEL